MELELLEEQQNGGAPVRRRRNQVAAAQETQEASMERVNKLIELIREQSYDKKLDPFNLAECVICFEEFSIGVPVRKIPVC